MRLLIVAEVLFSIYLLSDLFYISTHYKNKKGQDTEGKV